MPETARSSRPKIPLATLLTGVSSHTRWKIFYELMHGGPTTPTLLAKRIGEPVTNVSKHLAFLRDARMLERQVGRVYKVPEHFIVPGERTIDFGAVVLRLDQGKE